MLRQGLSTLLAPVRKFAGRTAVSTTGKAAGGLAPMGTAAEAAHNERPLLVNLMSGKTSNAVPTAKGPMVPSNPSLSLRSAALKKPAGGDTPKGASAPSGARKPAKAPSKAKKTIKKTNKKPKTKKVAVGAVTSSPTKAKKAVNTPKVKKAAKPSKARRAIKKK